MQSVYPALFHHHLLISHSRMQAINTHTLIIMRSRRDSGEGRSCIFSFTRSAYILSTKQYAKNVVFTCCYHNNIYVFLQRQRKREVNKNPLYSSQLNAIVQWSAIACARLLMSRLPPNVCFIILAITFCCSILQWFSKETITGYLHTSGNGNCHMKSNKNVNIKSIN